MKLYNFINEQSKEKTETQMEEIIDIIVKDCKPFLSEFDMFHNPIYRGTNRDDVIFDHVMKVRSRRKRKPKDTPKHIHDLMDDLFFKYYGWKPRSEGIFVTHNRSFAGNYGFQVYFFPKGKYQYLWHPQVEDIYATMSEIKSDPKSGINYDTYVRDIKKENMTPYFVKELENVIKNYQSKGFSKTTDRHEAMFKVFEYYMVTFDTQTQDREFLAKLQKRLKG